jgi:DNA-directed RNA polymerase subunit RPC12/RpoP
MSEIDLQEAKISFEGGWLSAQDLTKKIQEKMDAGDMKFSSLAAALEELNKALENSQKIETKIVILKEQYKKLKAFGGGDDRDCVLKAIKAFIEGGVQKKPAPESWAGTATKSEEKKKKILKCPKCKANIEIAEDEELTEIQCPLCQAIRHLKS